MYFEQFYLGFLAHASYMLGLRREAAVVNPLLPAPPFTWYSPPVKWPTKAPTSHAIHGFAGTGRRPREHLRWGLEPNRVIGRSGEREAGLHLC